MKTHKITLSGIIVLCALVVSSFTTVDPNLEALNDVLQNSLYKTVLSIDDNGTIIRKDDNGNSFTFKMGDISEINYENDGFHNMIIVLKKGKVVKGTIGGKEVEGSLNVISFDDKEDCDNAIDLFKKLFNGNREINSNKM